MSDATRFDECFEAKKTFFEEHDEVRKMSFHQTLITGDGWSNETQTDAAIAEYNELCTLAGGRFTLTRESVTKCSSSAGTNMAHLNVGECFPNIEACASFTLGSFLVEEVNKKFTHISGCQLISEVLETDIPTLPPSSNEASPPTVSPTLPPFASIPYDDTRRMACQQARNAHAGDHKSFVDFQSHYIGQQTHVHSSEWENVTTTEINAQQMHDQCLSSGGVPIKFTGILECFGTGEFKLGRVVQKAYINQVECFVAGKCDYYISHSLSQWYIDMNHVFSYSCRLESSSSEVPETEKEIMVDNPSSLVETGSSRNSGWIPLLGVLVVIVLAIAVIAKRRRRHSADVGQDLEMVESSYTDEEKKNVPELS